MHWVQGGDEAGRCQLLMLQPISNRERHGRLADATHVLVAASPDCGSVHESCPRITITGRHPTSGPVP